MASKVAYVNVEDNGTFSFHGADGKLVEVTGAKGYQTSDPGEIAYLDQVPFVKRAKQAGGEEA